VAQGVVDHLARGMIGRACRMEAEVQVKDARMTVREVPVGHRDVAQIDAPVIAWHWQLDGGERPVGNPPQELFLRAEVMQHSHGIDADTDAELAHRETNLALAREHVECSVQDCVGVEAASSARPRRRFTRCLR
jgi:hypothetical protein